MKPNNTKYQLGFFKWNYLLYLIAAAGLINQFIIEPQREGDSDRAFFSIPEGSKFTLDEEVKMMNKVLPKMIRDGLRMEKVLFQKRNLYYTYTYTNWLVAELDISASTSPFFQGVIKMICVEKGSRSLLDEGRDLVYTLRDKESKLIRKVSFDKSDCI